MSAYQPAGEHIAGEVVDDELIILNLLNGTYYGSSGAGRQMWLAITSGADMDVAVPFLAARAADAAAFGAAATAMVAALVADGVLVERAVAVPLDTVALSASIPDIALLAPTIEIHQDMEDLLMLDPIHDVGDAGWPVRPDTTPHR